MDPITALVSALAAGAATGLGDAASQAVKEAYGALKEALRARLRNRPDGELILERHEKSPETWKDPLTSELQAAHLDADDELQALARNLLDLLEEADHGAMGKYRVDASNAQGVQIGDHGAQDNRFSVSPTD